MRRCIPNTSYDCPFALGLVVVSFILALGATNPAALYLSFTTGAVGFALKLLTHHQCRVPRHAARQTAHRRTNTPLPPCLPHRHLL